MTYIPLFTTRNFRHGLPAAADSERAADPEVLMPVDVVTVSFSFNAPLSPPARPP